MATSDNYKPPMDPPPPYSVQADNPAVGAAPVIITVPGSAPNGTYVQQAGVQFQFPDHPVLLVCKHCHKTIMTNVESECLWDRVCTCIFCFACVVLVGFCAMSTKNCLCQGTKHSCPECKKELGWNK